MRWASSVGVETSFPRALDAACASLEAELGEAPQLLFLFLSDDFRAYWKSAPKILARRWPLATIVGASGVGVIGGLREVEGQGAIALMGGSLGSVEVSTFRVEVAAPGESAPVSFLSPPSAEVGSIFVFTNPFYVHGDAFVRSLEHEFPGVPIFGALASGGDKATEVGLFEGGELADVAAVGVTLSQEVEVTALVAPGCRPIGEPYIVTERDGNLILCFDRGRPLEALKDLHETLTSRERALFTESLSVGLEVGGQGARAGEDFLIRNLTGVSDERGGIFVGGALEDYQALQFHVRDAVTAAGDLRARLEKLESLSREFTGGLLFTCLGRGQSLYGRAGHDSDLIREILGEIPLGGVFGNGEIGPVGERSYLHGYASVLALFSRSSSD